MPFGKRLKDARLALGLTQEELAAAVGVTKGAIGNYESEVSSPKEPILIKLMNALQVDANYLYQDFIDPGDDLTEDELYLVSLYRNADDRARADAIRMLMDHQKPNTTASAI